MKIGLRSDLSWPKLGIEAKFHDPGTFGGFGKQITDRQRDRQDSCFISIDGSEYQICVFIPTVKYVCPVRWYVDFLILTFLLKKEMLKNEGNMYIFDCSMNTQILRETGIVQFF